jgi:glycosyltransferase involved in cell wall biosynthesis
MKVGIVSAYPERGQHHSEASGAEAFIKNVAQCLDGECERVVFANRLEDHDHEYTEDGMLIKRSWDRTLLYPLQIFFAVKDENPDVIHIQHEYNSLYGGPLNVLLFPLLLFMLRLTGQKIVCHPHQIITDPAVLSSEMVNSKLLYLPNQVLSFLFLMYNQSIVSLSHRVIAWENHFKSDLEDKCLVDDDEVVVIPHGVESPRSDQKSQTPPMRSDGGDLTKSIDGSALIDDSNSRVALYFGFISYYKGPDLLADCLGSLPEDWNVIFAGGKHPYLKEDPNYLSFYESVERKVAGNENACLTGFVDEEDIVRYFSAADVVILPYRLLMSGSGILPLALKHRTPFLISAPLSPIFQTSDFQKYLNNCDMLDESDLVFSSDLEDLDEKLANLSGDLYAEAEELSDQLKASRSWNALSDEYMDIYHQVSA